MLDVVHRACCGLDVHKSSVVARVLQVDAQGEVLRQTRTFGTVIADLLALADWLAACDVTHVAMESTGVFWRPIYNVLATDRLVVWVVNAAHLKAMPGRKTDVADAEWIASLLQRGLVRPSFIPDQPQRELRDLTRTRTTLIDERSAAVKRLHQVLEDANIKLTGVASDVLGVSGRAILAALLAGVTDPATLAELAKGKLRRKRAELERALAGRLDVHHRLLVGLHLEHIDFLDETIERLTEEIAERLRPLEAEVERLDSIPGVGRQMAEVLVAEIGVRMEQFPSAAHLASWAGMAPGNHQSGGVRRAERTRRGSPFLRRALVEAAHAAARKKGTYWAARYRRLVVRRGRPKAAVAIGHGILVGAYYVLARQETYREIDPSQYDERRRARLEKHAIEQLEALGFEVSLTQRLPAA